MMTSTRINACLSGKRCEYPSRAAADAVAAAAADAVAADDDGGGVVVGALPLPHAALIAASCSSMDAHNTLCATCTMHASRRAKSFAMLLLLLLLLLLLRLAWGGTLRLCAKYVSKRSRRLALCKTWLKNPGKSAEEEEEEEEEEGEEEEEEEETNDSNRCKRARLCDKLNSLSTTRAPSSCSNRFSSGRKTRNVRALDASATNTL